MGAILFTLCGIALFCVVLHLMWNNAYKKEQLRMQQKREREKQKEEAHRLRITELEQQYGTPVTLDLKCELGKYFTVFENARKVVIGDQHIDFTDIMSYQVRDNSMIVHSGTTSKTTTDNGSAFGRSVIGGVVGGAAGAVIGGSTASKTTTTSGSVSHTRHDYSIIIFTRSITTKPIELRTSQNVRITDQIANVLAVIVDTNK